jgi:hypothetical protein
MTLRRSLSWIGLALAASLVWTGCGNHDRTPPGADLKARCQLMAKACGDQEKHVQDIREACAQAAETQLARGCTQEAIAAYICFEDELCGQDDPVWALDDLRVLSERHQTCTAQREALRTCLATERSSED